MSIWRDDPFMSACQKLAAAEPAAFALFVAELLRSAAPVLNDPPSYSRIALGRVEGSLMAASLFIPKETPCPA